MSISEKSKILVLQLNDFNSSQKNDLMCILYQARYANNGYPIPAKTLNEILGVRFPKQYNSRVNKVYDWRDIKYQNSDGETCYTSHRLFLEDRRDKPSISTEYKNLLHFEKRVLNAAYEYFKLFGLPNGISSVKQLSRQYFQDFDRGLNSEAYLAVEKGFSLIQGQTDELTINRLIEEIQANIDTILRDGNEENKITLSKLLEANWLRVGKRCL